MIIDQLPLLSTDVQGTDEIPIERGTSTYKTTQAALVRSVAEKSLPSGGSTGAILAKVDGSDYNTEWIDPNYKFYNSVTQLGLTSGSATIAQAYAAMPNYSVLLADSSQFTSGSTPGIGIVEMVKATAAYRGYIFYHGKFNSNGDYRMFLDSQDTPTGTWEEIGGGLDLLWQNASPTSTFGPQTITLAKDSHNFDFLVFAVRTGGLQFIDSTFFDGAETALSSIGYVSASGFAVRSRAIYITNASVEFKDNRQSLITGTSPSQDITTRNDINQPVAIYGMNI